MSGLIGAMNTALSGLTAFDAGINAVSGNLANQTTPGYATETVNLSTAIASGQAGVGVQTPQLTRVADGFSAGLLRSANSVSQAADTQATNQLAISNALQNNGNIHSAINQFFLDVGSLSANPSNPAQQQTVLSDAQTISGTFQSAANTITSVINGATTALQQNVGTANNLLSQLAVINQGLAQSPNSPALLDQQQSALQSLSSIVTVNVLPQNNGQVLVASGGTALLDQSGAQILTLNGGTAGNPPQITAGNAGSTLAPAGSDGSMGANIQTWQTGGQALRALNARAAVFSASINQSQAQGLTPAGQPGTSVFSIPNPSVTNALGNSGTATLNAQLINGSQLPTDGGPFMLSYNAPAGWSVINQANQQSYALGNATPLSFAGLSIAVSGSAASGDQFLVNPAPGAASGLTVIAKNPNSIASADPYVVTPGAFQSDGSTLNNNAGTITAGTDTVVNAPPANAATVPAAFYGQTLQVTFTSPTNYNISSTLKPGTMIASGSLLSGQGQLAVAFPAGGAAGQFWQIPISGIASAGDVLTVSPGGSSSGSNASRMASIWTAPSASMDGSLQQSVLGLGTLLAANAQQAQQRATATSAQVTTASNNLQTIAGVSLDQQAVVLTGYSQAYQAAAQVISTAHTMFESLLQAI
jgi:flagellar hook-associated protein 1 FlgK